MVELPEREYAYFEVNAFSNLLLAAVETYPKECTGLIFGYETRDPESSRFEVWSAIPHQIVYDRAKDSVVEDIKAYLRMVECQRKITGASHLGGFHSHIDADPILSESDRIYLKEKKHQLETVIGIQEIGEEGPGWRSINNDLLIQGHFAIGDSIYSINVAASYLKGNRIQRLGLRCGYVEILQELANYGLPNLHTLGDLYERARTLGKDVYPIAKFIEDLEANLDTTKRKKREIVREIRDYLETP